MYRKIILLTALAFITSCTPTLRPILINNAESETDKVDLKKNGILAFELFQKKANKNEMGVQLELQNKATGQNYLLAGSIDNGTVSTTKIFGKVVSQNVDYQPNFSPTLALYQIPEGEYSFTKLYYYGSFNGSRRGSDITLPQNNFSIKNNQTTFIGSYEADGDWSMVLFLEYLKLSKIKTKNEVLANLKTITQFDIQSMEVSKPNVDISLTKPEAK